MRKTVSKILLLIMCCCVCFIVACGDTTCLHNYTSTVTKEASCKETGIKTYTCTLCNSSYTETISKTSNHNYTSTVTKEASCKETGIKTYTCTLCNSSYTETISITNDHIWQEATCKKAKSCEVCKKTSGEIDVYAHIGQNSCTICGIDYFNEIANYIKLYGTYSNNKAIIKYSAYYSGKLYSVEFDYNLNSNKIIIGVNGASSGYTGISLGISADLSGSYGYSYLDMVGDTIDSMDGTIIASDMTVGITELPYEEIKSYNNKHTAVYIQANACKYIKLALIFLNEFAEKNNLRVGTRDLGFNNYPSN